MRRIVRSSRLRSTFEQTVLTQNDSHSIIVGRRLRQADQRQDPSATVIHGGQAQDHGRCHESDEDGAGVEKSTGEGETLDRVVQ